MSSPLAISFSTLPQHWKLANRLSNAQWGGNLLAGGDFEDLDVLLTNGWRQERASMPHVATRVELSFQTPRSGRASLRMQSWPEAGNRSVCDHWPVFLTSAPIPVQHGQLLRIQGWVRVPGAISGSHDGFLVFDSLGGLDLAERIGNGEGWREFVLYRAAPRNAMLTVTFALTGLGEVWLDDVSVSVIR
jgi:hypothetical protein